MIKIRYVIWLSTIIITLFIGVMIYFQSSKDLIAFRWIESISPWFFHKLQSLASSFPQIHQKGWVDYHLADILWSSACASLMVGIWVDNLSYKKLLILGTGCAIFYEVLQGFRLTNGTFDIWDLVFSFFAGLLSTICTYLFLKKDRFQ